MEYSRKVTLITGDYGCGKTNFAVNLALFLAEKGKVSLVDIDSVNPYFRAADFTKLLAEKGVDVVYPQFANTNLDVPAFDFDLEAIASQSDFTIIDAGGSEAGAYPAGRFEKLFSALGSDFSALYVFNMYRHCGRSAEQVCETLREIESACRVKCSALVNNSNLGAETTPETVRNSADFAEDVSRISGLPILFTCVCENDERRDGVFPVKRLVKLPWENFSEE